MSCVGDVKKLAKNNGYDKPTFCIINMANILECKGGLMSSMLKKMARPLQIDAKTAKLDAYEAQFEKKVFVLILDEINTVFKRHDGGFVEAWFRTLVEWAEDKELRFSMIGASNCVDDTNAQRVRMFGKSPRELVFAAYEEEDIVAILEERLGETVVDPKALQLISRKVAASSGDARRALEITSNAVGKCIDLLSEANLDAEVTENDECMPLVKLQHVLPLRHCNVICGLPQAAKVILCIAVSLSKVWGPTAFISIPTLKKYCMEATYWAIMDKQELGKIANLVEMLVDSGLLIAGRDRTKLRVDVQLLDVEMALEESLLKEGGFYQSLVDYAKRECPRAY